VAWFDLSMCEIILRQVHFYACMLRGRLYKWSYELANKDDPDDHHD